MSPSHRMVTHYLGTTFGVNNWSVFQHQDRINMRIQDERFTRTIQHNLTTKEDYIAWIL